MPGPRVAIIGLFGENTVFRAPLAREGYPWMALYAADELFTAIGDPDQFVAPETRGFWDGMDASGPWTPVPIYYALSASGPMLAESHLQALFGRIDTALAAAGPVDAVYITGHGSFVAEQTRDVDGALLALVRRRVGLVPIVETLDLHGQVTPQMIDLADLLIAYQTDPHVDNYERGQEAAAGMRQLLAGTPVASAYVRLPLMMPTAAIVAKTSPFQEAVGRGQRAVAAGTVCNVSLLPGYPFTDSPDAGFHVLVSSWGDAAAAETVALDLGAFLWGRRDGFLVQAIGLADMQSQVRQLLDDPSLPAACFADIADNPGGGGTGNTTAALQALLANDAQNVAVGPFWEPDAAAAAHATGVGATFDIVLNQGREDRFAHTLPVRATVLALADGKFHARGGPAKGVSVDQGPTAALRIGGVTVVVTTRCLQALAVEQFEMVGVDLSAVRAVVVKSRGHYQASFAEFFDRERMIEIDTPGWMSPELERLEYRRLARPILPLDPGTEWDGRIFHRKDRAA